MIRRLTVAVATLATLYHVLYVSRILINVFGVVVLPIQHRSISLAFMLVLTFLTFRASGNQRKDRLPWYDGLLMAASVGVGLYPILFYKDLTFSLRFGMSTPVQQVLGALAIVLILEACRRVIGWSLPIIVALFALHPFFLTSLPGIFGGPAQSLSRIFNVMYLSSDGILGTVIHVASTIIIMFIVFGVFFQYTGAADFFVDLSRALIGRVRGAPAKVAVLGSSLLGSVSGSSTGNAATTGAMTIPMMKRAGFSGEFAAAVEAVSSNGGQMLPPVMGVVAFLVAEFLGVPYSQVVVAGFLPALIFYLVLFIQVDLRAARLNLRANAVEEDIPTVGETMRKGWFFLIPVAVLLYVLIGLRYNAEQAAWWSIVALIVVSLFKKETRLTWPRFEEAMVSLPQTFLPAGVATAAAGIIMASLGLTGLGIRLATGLVEIAGGNLYFLLAVAAATCFVLGMGMSSVPLYVIMATTVAPNLVRLGIEPLAAHLFVFWWGATSFITPPVAMTVYITASIADTDPIRSGFQATKLGIAHYVLPFMFVLQPNLLLMGDSLVEIVGAAVTATIGAVFLAAAVEGYLVGVLRWWERVLILVTGLALIYPEVYSDIIALVVAGLVIANRYWERARAPQEALGRW